MRLWCLNYFLIISILLYDKSAVAEVEYLVSPKCDYLKTGPGQQNSYTDGKLMCCMCPMGQRLVSACNPMHPNTTVCEACQYDPDDPDQQFFIDFEPHMQQKCFRQKQLHCLSPKVKVEGSATQQSRCVCPEGMEEAPASTLCRLTHKVPTASIIVTKIMESTAITRNSRNPATSNVTVTDYTSSTLMASSQGDTGIKDTSTSIPKTLGYTGSDNDTFVQTSFPDPELDSTVNTTGLPSGKPATISGPLQRALTVIGLGVLAICIFVLHCWWKRKRCEIGGDPTESSQTLTERSKADIDTVRWSNDASPVKNNATPSRNRDPGIMNNRIQPGQGDQEQSLLDEIEQDVHPEQPNPAIPNPEVDLHPRPPARGNMDPRIEEIAERWKTKIWPCHIREVFRAILAGDCHNDIEDIVEVKFKGSTREQVVQLMRLAHTRLGGDLTPQYLLQKLRQCGDHKNLEDIVEDVAPHEQHGQPV